MRAKRIRKTANELFLPEVTNFSFSPSSGYFMREKSEGLQDGRIKKKKSNLRSLQGR